MTWLKSTTICLLQVQPARVSSIIDCYPGLVSYADDFVITGHSKELLEGEVEPLVGSFCRSAD
ncbi:hypothetical protein BZM26_36795 [Paraburkholderia strydomiana]|nr:hypothetical protein BZM26_36795 [Paraburkholderia strydomiana]